LDPVGKEVKEGVKSYKMRKFQDAMEHFERASKEHHSDKRHSYNKGTTHYQLKDYDEAIKQFGMSTASKDKNIRTHSYYNMGNSYYQKGDTLNSIRSYIKALENDPNFSPARKNLELIRKMEEEKNNKQNSEQNQDQKKESNQNSAKNKPNSTNDNSQKQNSKSENTDPQKQNENRMSDEDAERILESTKQNEVKRKKGNQLLKNNNKIFW
jgi:tetratricopeptide (TPR) repeat protein